MSERDANEKRKIPVGKLASLVHSAVNKNTAPQQADASEEGRGPKEPETKATVPQQADASEEGQGPKEPETKAAVPQRADASEEGRGPKEPETKAAVPQRADASEEGQEPKEPETKAAVPQRADASEEGQEPKEPETKAAVPQRADASEEDRGPKEPERGKDPESKRIRELVKLLTATIDSNDAKTDEKIIELARNLSERKRGLIQIAAVKIEQTEERTEVALDQFTDRIVTFHDVLTKTLKEGNGQKALERAQKTLDDIQMSYWDRFVKGVNDTYQNKLDDAKQQIQGVLDKATDNFSKHIAALLDKSIREVQSPVGSLKLRAFRERRLLVGALVLGLMLGSVLGIMRHTLWNSAEVASRQALRVFGPFVLPLSGRSEQ